MQALLTHYPQYPKPPTQESFASLCIVLWKCPRVLFQCMYLVRNVLPQEGQGTRILDCIRLKKPILKQVSSREPENLNRVDPQHPNKDHYAGINRQRSLGFRPRTSATKAWRARSFLVADFELRVEGFHGCISRTFPETRPLCKMGVI